MWQPKMFRHENANVHTHTVGVNNIQFIFAKQATQLRDTEIVDELFAFIEQPLENAFFVMNPPIEMRHFVWNGLFPQLLTHRTFRRQQHNRLHSILLTQQKHKRIERLIRTIKPGIMCNEKNGHIKTVIAYLTTDHVRQLQKFFNSLIELWRILL